MDISGNVIIQRTILTKIITYLNNHLIESRDPQYRSMLNYIIAYLKILHSK